MATEYLDLDELRSVDDLSNYRATLQNDINSWEDEYKGRALPDELKPSYQKHNAEIDRVDNVILELKARNQRLADLASRSQNVEAGDAAPFTPATPKWDGAPTQWKQRDRSAIWDVNRSTEVGDLQERAKYAIEELRPPSWVDRAEAQSALLDRLDDEGVVAQHIILHGSPAYKSAFTKVLRAGMGGFPSLNPIEQRAMDMAQRAMSLTGSAGGFGVPYDLDPTLINTSNGVVNPIRSIARIVNTTVDTWRGVTTGAITAAYAAESTETTDNSPTLAQPEISTERAQAFVPMSIEINMDFPALRDELGALFADAKDVLEATKFLTGTGTNEPFGVITGATNTINATAAGVFDLEDLYRLRQALPPRYRARASFMGDLIIFDTIRRFDTVGSSAAIWVDGLQNDNPPRLLGKPAYEASEMTDVTTVGAKFLIYGDFNRYVIVDRVGLTVDFIPHLFGANQRPTGQRGLFAFWRNGAKVVDANAFRVLLGLA